MNRRAEFEADFLEDLNYWTQQDRKTAFKILTLVQVCLRDPFSGLGKPEPLKYLGAGVWSRRISQEHRLVYLVDEERVVFVQARLHY